MSYRQAQIGVIREEDGVNLRPGAPGWDEYQAWVRAGNLPTPIVIELPPITPDDPPPPFDYGPLERALGLKAGEGAEFASLLDSAIMASRRQG